MAVKNIPSYLITGLRLYYSGVFGVLRAELTKLLALLQQEAEALDADKEEIAADLPMEQGSFLSASQLEG